MMAAPSPHSMAMVKNAALMISLWGSPKDMLDTPSTVPTPSSSRMRRRVSRVVRAPLLSELTVMQSPSRMISSGPIPYSAARSMIFLPTARRPSAVSGMPDSSRQRPTATPPYFAISGNMRLMDSSLPLTELISGFPLYIRMARSMASMSEVSI